MAFSKYHLTNSGRPNRLTAARTIRWLTYATDDAKAVVIAAGYFNDARPDLSVGSIIDCVVNAAAGAAYVKLRVTAVPATGNVTVADITAVAAG